MKKISRKGFLKVAAAAAMSGVTASALAACNAGSSSSTAATGEAIYTPGTYTGTATGMRAWRRAISATRSRPLPSGRRMSVRQRS